MTLPSPEVQNLRIDSAVGIDLLEVIAPILSVSSSKTNAFLATGYYLSNAIQRLWNLIFTGGNFRIHFSPSSVYD
jgi:hypothetical protein